MVLESWYYTRRWSSGSPGIRGTIPGNSQQGVVGYQFPRRRQKRSWRPGITPDAGVGVVLEAWYYTRRWSRGGPGGLVLHQGGWDRSDPRGGNWIPGNSRLCSSVQIPQIVAMTESIPTAARGVDTNGLRHLYQGSVGDGKRLEYWCSKFTRGH